MKRLERYMPLNMVNFATILSAADLYRHPDFVVRNDCFNMFKDWEHYLGGFMEDAALTKSASFCGLTMKNRNTIAAP
jgi:hypothetical protein